MTSSLAYDSPFAWTVEVDGDGLFHYVYMDLIRVQRGRTGFDRSAHVEDAGGEV